VKSLVEKGGEVINREVFFTFSASRYGEEVPSCLPNRTYEDAEGVIHVKTWDEWFTSKPIDINGKLYCILSTNKELIPATSYVPFFKIKTAISVYTLSKFTEITKEDYLKALPKDVL
jgi:hypothetical protein